MDKALLVMQGAIIGTVTIVLEAGVSVAVVREAVSMAVEVTIRKHIDEMGKSDAGH